MLSVLASSASGIPNEPDVKPLPSRKQVLAAIDRLLCRPRVDRMRPEFPFIFDFAEASHDVFLALEPRFWDASGDRNLDAILLGYFVAGAVKFDLENPALARTPKADAAASIRAALLYYRLHRTTHPGVIHPLYDKLDRLDREGGLERYIAEQPPAATH